MIRYATSSSHVSVGAVHRMSPVDFWSASCEGKDPSRWRPAIAYPIFILNFHGLGRPPRDVSPDEEKFWIEAPFFEAILDLARGRSDVQLTFDDANESDYATALPALEARNLTGKFFIVMGSLGHHGYLSIRQLQALAAAGMGVGSHGMRHRRWTRLCAHDLNEELVEARYRLEQTVGLPVEDVACPFGSYNRHVLSCLRKLGYQRIYTSDGGPANLDAVVQARNTVLRRHNLGDIREVINSTPRGLKRAWRGLKQTLKRWR